MTPAPSQQRVPLHQATHAAPPATLHPARDAGFTLSELLIVLVVVVVASAFLLPAFRYALTNAQAAKCIGNLRQVGTAIIAYAGEHHGYAPPITTPDERPWFQQLAEKRYLPSTGPNESSTFQCPDSVSSPTIGTKSYGMVTDGDALHGGWKILFVEKVSWYRTHPTAYQGSMVRNNLYTPSRFILVGDSAILGVEKNLQWYYVTPATNHYSASTRLMHTRHGNKANVIFADGHGATVTGEELEANGIRSYKTSSGKAQNGISY